MSAKRWRMRCKFRGFFIKEIWRAQLLEKGFISVGECYRGADMLSSEVAVGGASRERAFAPSRA